MHTESSLTEKWQQNSQGKDLNEGVGAGITLPAFLEMNNFFALAHLKAKNQLPKCREKRTTDEKKNTPVLTCFVCLIVCLFVGGDWGPQPLVFKGSFIPSSAQVLKLN